MSTTKILARGFDPKCGSQQSGRMCYGQGCYFASDLSYSANDCYSVPCVCRAITRRCHIQSLTRLTRVRVLDTFKDLHSYSIIILLVTSIHYRQKSITTRSRCSTSLPTIRPQATITTRPSTSCWIRRHSCRSTRIRRSHSTFSFSRAGGQTGDYTTILYRVYTVLSLIARVRLFTSKRVMAGSYFAAGRWTHRVEYIALQLYLCITTNGAIGFPAISLA